MLLNYGLLDIGFVALGSSDQHIGFCFFKYYIVYLDIFHEIYSGTLSGSTMTSGCQTF